jgi:predicted NBD/HSP70 family sugar kinase
MPLRRSTVINLTLLRHIHAARIFHAIRRRPGLSQRDIVEATGADKSTVSAVVQDFEAMGLIERGANRAGKRPGRPGEAIILSPQGGLLVGVHPRPQQLTYSVSGLDGEPLTTLARPMTLDAAEFGAEVAAGIAAITAAVGRSVEEVRAVGIAVPGLVRSDGILTQSPNLGWRDINLKTLVGAHVTAPLFVDNNANAATVAEFMFGVGFDLGDFAYVESGSGVGAGLFLDGALYRGALGFAGEFGHTKIVPHGRLCRCGGQGCISAYVSDYSIMERLRQRGRSVLNRDDVLTLAADGDAVTLDALAEAGHHLGVGLANLVNLLNIQLFMLGGGLEAFAPYMRASAEAAIRELSLPSPAAGVRLETSHVAARGGIALALEGCTSLRNTEAAPWQGAAEAATT